MVYLIFVIESEEDSALVNELFVSHNKKLFNIALSIVNNKDIAEDALQDGFIKIINNLQKIQKIPSHERVRFCVVIVKNASVSILRKNSRLLYSEDLTYPQEDTLTNIEDEYLEKEDIAAMLQYLGQLSPSDRQLILLRHGDGLPYKEIGNFFGISEELARKRAQRILSKMRKAMALSNTEDSLCQALQK